MASKLGPAVGGDVGWYVPHRKRPVAYTTRATSDSMDDLVAGGIKTFNEMDAGPWLDPDLHKLCKIMDGHGYGDSLLEGGPHGWGIRIIGP